MPQAGPQPTQTAKAVPQPTPPVFTPMLSLASATTTDAVTPQPSAASDSPRLPLAPAPINPPASPPAQGAPAPAASGLVTSVASGSDPAPRTTVDDAPLVSELRLSADPGQSPRAQPDGAQPRAELPRHVAAQLAEAMQRGPNRPVELTLSPAELGRVRINLQTGDGGVVVHISADRPETLDLMRRHVEQLAQEFHQIGYGTAQFSFAGQGSGQGRTPADGALAPAHGHEDEGARGETPTGRPTDAIRLTDRVDIRI